MDVLSFLILYGIGIILTFLSVKSKSYPIGMFAGLIMFLSSLSMMVGGLQVPIVEVTINETGSLITDSSAIDMIGSTDLLDKATFGLPLMLFGLYIMIEAILSWNAGRDAQG